MVTVAIVDDHESVRIGLRASCLDAGFAVTGEAATVDALLPVLVDKPTDMVVLDLSLCD